MWKNNLFILFIIYIYYTKLLVVVVYLLINLKKLFFKRIKFDFWGWDNHLLGCKYFYTVSVNDINCI